MQYLQYVYKTIGVLKFLNLTCLINRFCNRDSSSTETCWSSSDTVFYVFYQLLCWRESFWAAKTNTNYGQRDGSYFVGWDLLIILFSWIGSSDHFVWRQETWTVGMLVVQFSLCFHNEVFCITKNITIKDGISWNFNNKMKNRELKCWSLIWVHDLTTCIWVLFL